MAKAKAHARHLPVLLPDSLRPPPALPDAASVIEMGFPLTADEITVIRMAMALHTASKQPKLTWKGWRHIAVAVAIGSEHAKKAAKGRLDTPDYRRVMTEFLRKTGLAFLNKDDRAQAVRMLPHWEDIDAWRSSLSSSQQQNLNNPREVWREYDEHRKALGHPEASRTRPGVRDKRREFPSLLEQYVAVVEQLDLANERTERAEHEAEYFAGLAQEIAKAAKLDDDAIAKIRARVRGEREAE
jgi:hypothetical protein